MYFFVEFVVNTSHNPPNHDCRKGIVISGGMHFSWFAILKSAASLAVFLQVWGG
jgi:hypothetical protein